MAKRTTPTDPASAPEPQADPDGGPAPGAAAGAVPDADRAAIVGGYHGAPHKVLGPHLVEVGGKTQVAVRAFRPLDARVVVHEFATGARTEMNCTDAGGFFEALFDRAEPFAYRLIVIDDADEEFELEDPYRFPFLLTEFDLHLYSEGNFFGCYEKFGAHFRTIETGAGDVVKGVNFAVWAPNALRVGVIGTSTAGTTAPTP